MTNELEPNTSENSRPGTLQDTDNIAKYDSSICLSVYSIVKKLSYRRLTARHAMSVEILSAAAQLYEKSHLKRLAVGECS